MLSTGHHTLTNQPDGDDESAKICILVKLTDSSVKAIEEFLKNKGGGVKRPTITFQKDRGEITLPIESSSSAAATSKSGSADKKFLFTLSSIKETAKDTSASSECICFTGSKLITVAPIEQKMTVLANDEVFLATKEKVNSGVEEEKKNSTKEIKPSGGLIGSRNGNASSTSLAHSHMNRNKNLATNSAVKNVAVSSVTTTATATAAAAAASKPILERPLRERLVHMLALKPYTRAEILLRLFFRDQSMAASEREKEAVDDILQEVASLNPKTSMYELTKETVLNEVNDEWPFYSQAERLAVKRTIIKIKQQPVQPTTTTAKSTPPPAASIGGQQQKMAPSSSAFVSIKQQQQQKSNLLETSSSDLLWTPSNNNTTTTSSKISPNKQQQTKATSSIKQPLAAADSALLADLSISSTAYNRSSLAAASNDHHANSNNSHHQSSHNDNANKKLKSEVLNMPTYKDRQSEIEANEINECAKYKKIMSDQQRDQYVKEFNKYHPQYAELYKYMDALSKRFLSFQHQLAQLREESSPEYQDLKRRVQTEYLELQSSKEFLQKRERFWQLEVRLQHIDELIKEWSATATTTTSSQPPQADLNISSNLSE